MPATVKQVFDPLYNNVAAAFITWKIFRQLFIHSKERTKLLNDVGKGFFSVVQDLLRDSTFMTLARMTDPARSMGCDNLTLKQLQKKIKDSGDVTFANSMNADITQIQTANAAIRQWRNRRLAHSDLQTVLTFSSAPLPGVSSADVRAILAQIANLMNRVAVHFAENTTAYQGSYSNGDGNHIASVLQSAKEHDEKQLEALKRKLVPKKK